MKNNWLDCFAQLNADIKQMILKHVADPRESILSGYNARKDDKAFGNGLIVPILYIRHKKGWVEMWGCGFRTQMARNRRKLMGKHKLVSAVGKGEKGL